MITFKEMGNLDMEQLKIYYEGINIIYTKEIKN